MLIKKNIPEILIIVGIFFLLFNSTDPIFYSDSSRYIESSLKDPPLYSFIIMVIKSIFENFNSIVVLQTLCVGFGIINFTKVATNHLNLDLLTKTLTALFLFLPLIQFYKNILTEPFSYGFSLLFVSFVLRLIFNFNLLNLFWSSFFAIAMLLIRNQFIFLYLVILILYLGIFSLNNSKKTFILLIFSFISIFIIHNSLISLNKYVKKDSFDQNNLFKNNSGIFYFTYIDAIYISNANDLKLFDNQEVQKTLTKIINEVDYKKSSVKYYNGRGHFGSSFATIRDLSISPLKNLAVQENISVIDLKKNISYVLIKKNFAKYLKLIFKKFYDSTWLFIFIPFFILLASLISFLKYKSHLALLYIFLSTFTLSNHSVVYLFGRVQPRYLIYTDFILLIFIFITIVILLRKKR